MMWINVLLVLIMILGLFVFMNGLKKKSQIQLYLGTLGLIAPVFIWIKITIFLLLAPIIALLVAQFTFKKLNSK